MQGIQCDNCRTFTQDTSNWIVVSRVGGLTGLFGQPVNEMAGTFCTVRCLAEWAYVKAAIESEAVEAAPRPRPRRKKAGGMEDRPGPPA